MEHALEWFLAHAPTVFGWCMGLLGTALTTALTKHVVPALFKGIFESVTKRYVSAWKESEALEQRAKEEAEAAEAFTADARTVLEDANRNLAEELRTAHEDLQRALRGQMAAEKQAAAIEVMAKEALAQKEAEIAELVELSGVRLPRSDPPDVTEEDERVTGRPPPLPPLRAPWGAGKNKP